MKRILFISPPILKGSGGEVIRKRNRDFLLAYVGGDNILHFPLPYCPYCDERSKTLIENKLKEVVDNFRPDLIHIDNSLMAIPDFIFEHKTIVFFHNIEAKYAKQDNKFSEEMVKLIKDNEENLVKKASYLVSINNRDSDELLEYYGRGADYVLPISFKDQYVICDKDIKGEYMLFVGSDFYGNTDGLFWFIENCLDKIDSKLLVVGKGMEKYSGRFTDKKVNFLGFVDDLSILYANASCVILPIISGSGMKTKTCEAFMYGKKCFGTKEAFEGYIDVEKANIVSCNDENEFITEINEYLKTNHCAYVNEARTYFLNNYENEVVLNKYLRFLKEQVNI